MKKLQVLNLLEQILGKGRQLKQDEVAFFCPFCKHHKPKLQVNLVSYHYNCWVCRAGGKSLFSLLKRLDAPKHQFEQLSQLIKPTPYTPDAKPETEEAELHLPSQFRSIASVSKDPDYRNALKYLLRRGLTKEDILRYNIGYCDSGSYGGMVIVPSYSDTGKLNYFVGRSFYSDSYKYRNPSVSKNVVGFDMHINWDEGWLTLTEGVFDSIALRRNAIPLFGKFLPKLLLEKIVTQRITRVNICLDSDAKQDAIRLAETFLKYDIVPHIVLPEQGKDPASIGFRQMWKLIEESKPVTSLELIRMKV